ncbi:hypothetical protein NP233_g3436 [Leucocoprinus birnbaumii]|uniref:Uncharacterized protein n=1 Tax=Leucocoprinus birnbaumii TaxID=56174 RepID=A0AAD5VWG8_9AGAR|nr:hypothetical protein NP233_g3436 [Leucocoprinus birnbaumii]
MWLIPDMTTAPQIQMLSPLPVLPPSPSKRQQHDPSDWQYRNPLSALFPLNNFPSAMSPYITEYNEFPNSSTNNTPSSVGLMSSSNDPSYGSESTEWHPDYPLTYGATERQSQIFPVAPFPDASWSQPSVAPQDIPRYPIYNGNSLDFQLMVGQPPVPSRSAPSPAMTSPDFPVEQSKKGIYTHREQQQFFRDALSLPAMGFTGPFVPQQMYKPHTNSDRKRYVEEIELDPPIFFWMTGPEECGISLTDALHSRVKRLRDRDLPVFEGRGPSVSIRLEWPGYRQWSRQIPTKDFRSPPGPITLAKLAKNVAKCVQRFIEERQHSRLEDDADPRWQVGLNGKGVITLDDIVLVSMYHVSLGSWQPQLRLKRPFNQPIRG